MSTYISTGKAAETLGVGIKTLQRWDREGILKPEARSPTGRRMYTAEQLEAALNRQSVKAFGADQRKS